MPEDAPSVQTALEVADASLECAFLLFLPWDFDVKGQITALTVHNNIMLVVDTEKPDWTEKAQTLREKKCLYSLFRHYVTLEDGEDIISGQWMERIRPWAGMASLLLPMGGFVAAGLQPAVSRYALASRLEQRYPTVMVDFYSDVIYMDMLISESPCFLGVMPDGTVTECRENREICAEGSVRSAPLAELLRRFTKPESACKAGPLG